MRNKLIKKSVLLTAISCVVLPMQGNASYLNHPASQEAGEVYHLVATDLEGQKAQEFIDKMGKNAISFLGNAGLSKAQKTQKFRKLLKNSFDMKTISRFAMGRYWKTASQAQKTEYQKLFEGMIVDVYSARFADYKGEGFNVFAHRVDGKRDFLVNSAIVPKGGS